MSAGIKTSLQKLNSAVGKLEGALATVQANKKAIPAKPVGQPQNDLFSTMTANKNPSNVNSLNVRMLATRLDNAINQVEQILKEGRA